MNEILSHPNVVRVRAALNDAGVHADVVVLDEHARTAAAAAEQLGVSTAQIANSLVFAVPAMCESDGERSSALILTSGAHRVDVAKVAAELGVPRLERAEAEFVRLRTGFAIGGVAPLAHLSTPGTIVVDRALEAHSEIWAAAGHPRTVFPTTFEQLLQITGGTPLNVN